MKSSRNSSSGMMSLQYTESSYFGNIKGRLEDLTTQVNNFFHHCIHIVNCDIDVPEIEVG
ncbi:MAG: hypothetical protein K8S24_06500 [Candidatus Aegiribacteria sp.]|nr:hypothetical protein [Candidatus Aegiribacteria sp.]